MHARSRSLTPAERSACKELLGFEQEKWDDRLAYPTPNDQTSEDCKWNALEAAKILGFNEGLWDGECDPEICKESWQQLTLGQRRSAMVLWIWSREVGCKLVDRTYYFRQRT